MIMKDLCPHCGALQEHTQNNEIVDPMEFVTNETIMLKMSRHCEKCGKEYLISEMFEMTSHILARDDAHLDQFIDPEAKVDNHLGQFRPAYVSLVSETDDDMTIRCGADKYRVTKFGKGIQEVTE